MTLEYVDFPAMGLRVPVARTLFRVFGQDIYTYAVIIALSIVLMIVLGLRHAERYGIKQEFIIDFMIFALPASIICARLYYVVFTWESYRGNLLSIFNIRQGGIAIYGAVIGAFLTVLIFSKVKKVSAIKFLDFGVPYLILAQGIGRWGNFVNQEVFGTNTSLPWGMTSDRIAADLAFNAQRLSTLGISVNPMVPVHPTFLYESLWNILIACILFALRRRRKYKGEVLLGYLIGYGAGRTFIEGMRTDSLMLGGFRISQLISVLIVVASLFIIIFLRRLLKRYSDEPVVGIAGAEREDGGGEPTEGDGAGGAAELEEEDDDDDKGGIAEPEDDDEDDKGSAVDPKDEVEDDISCAEPAEDTDGGAAAEPEDENYLNIEPDDEGGSGIDTEE